MLKKILYYFSEYWFFKAIFKNLKLKADYNVLQYNYIINFINIKNNDEIDLTKNKKILNSFQSVLRKKVFTNVFSYVYYKYVFFFVLILSFIFFLFLIKYIYQFLIQFDFYDFYTLDLSKSYNTDFLNKLNFDLLTNQLDRGPFLLKTFEYNTMAKSLFFKHYYNKIDLGDGDFKPNPSMLQKDIGSLGLFSVKEQPYTVYEDARKFSKQLNQQFKYYLYYREEHMTKMCYKIDFLHSAIIEKKYCGLNIQNKLNIMQFFFKQDLRLKYFFFKENYFNINTNILKYLSKNSNFEKLARDLYISKYYEILKNGNVNKSLFIWNKFAFKFLMLQKRLILNYDFLNLQFYNNFIKFRNDLNISEMKLLADYPKFGYYGSIYKSAFAYKKFINILFKTQLNAKQVLLNEYNIFLNYLNLYEQLNYFKYDLKLYKSPLYFDKQLTDLVYFKNLVSKNLLINNISNNEKKIDFYDNNIFVKTNFDSLSKNDLMKVKTEFIEKKFNKILLRRYFKGHLLGLYDNYLELSFLKTYVYDIKKEFETPMNPYPMNSENCLQDSFLFRYTNPKYTNFSKVPELFYYIRYPLKLK